MSSLTIPFKVAVVSTAIPYLELSNLLDQARRITFCIWEHACYSSHKRSQDDFRGFGGEGIPGDTDLVVALGPNAFRHLLRIKIAGRTFRCPVVCASPLFGADLSDEGAWEWLASQGERGASKILEGFVYASIDARFPH